MTHVAALAVDVVNAVGGIIIAFRCHDQEMIDWYEAMPKRQRSKVMREAVRERMARERRRLVRETKEAPIVVVQPVPAGIETVYEDLGEVERYYFEGEQ